MLPLTRVVNRTFSGDNTMVRHYFQCGKCLCNCSQVVNKKDIDCIGKFFTVLCDSCGAEQVFEVVDYDYDEEVELNEQDKKDAVRLGDTCAEYLQHIP